MAQFPSLSTPALESGPLLSPREEALRFARAAERFLERARKDPALARKLLSDIGYDEMMEAQQRESQTAPEESHKAETRVSSLCDDPGTTIHP